VRRRTWAPCAFRLTVIGIVCTFVLAGCGGGGGGKVDSGGFTASQFNAARNALTLLGQTSVYDAALKLSYTQAEVPTACVVHIEQEKPLTFKVFMTWVPNKTSLGVGKVGTALRSFSWLEAVIGAQGLKSDYSFHQGNELSMADLKTHYGNAFSKPVHRCLVLQNQKFGLLPSG
jgi:hypothetical protein